MTNKSYINDLAKPLSGVRAFCRLGDKIRCVALRSGGLSVDWKYDFLQYE